MEDTQREELTQTSRYRKITNNSRTDFYASRNFIPLDKGLKNSATRYHWDSNPTRSHLTEAK